MSQNGTTKRTLMNLIRRRDDATIWTGVSCARCGRAVKARNKKAQQAIVQAAGMGVPVKCAGCGG